MAIADDKRRALRALDMMRRGLSDVASLAAAAADERAQVDPATQDADVLRSVRTLRFLVVHELDQRRHREGRAGAEVGKLLDDVPEDVIVVPLGHSPEDEAMRDRLMAALGCGYSSHTAVYAWQDSAPSTDEEGNPITVPAGWRLVPLRDRSAFGWEIGPPVENRRSDAKTWAKLRAAPPTPEDY